MKAYRVCHVKLKDTSWSGVVIADDEEDVHEAIMKHHGVKNLITNKDHRQVYGCSHYDVEEIPIESVSVCDLTVGELIKLLKHLN